MDLISYRKATLDDLDALCAIRLAFLYEDREKAPQEDEIRLVSEIKDYLKVKLPRREYVSWIAEIKGRVIACSGMVIWQRIPSFALTPGRLGYIMNMYTMPEYRKQGIATRLLDLLLEDARELDLQYVHLNAMESGLNLYKEYGFWPQNHPELILKVEPSDGR